MPRQAEDEMTTTKQQKAAASAYDAFKEFEGRRYTGAKVGRRQKWRYDQGEWKERKITPDRWEIDYAVTKRRAGRAPEGSGVPVGTEYHWYILAHQFVRKLNANDYTTQMVGVKFKVAHKRADKDAWSASDRARRKRLVAYLREVIAELEEEPATAPVEAEPAPRRRAQTDRPRRTPRPHSRARTSTRPKRSARG
jgi:hypothetical protein